MIRINKDLLFACDMAGIHVDFEEDVKKISDRYDLEYKELLISAINLMLENNDITIKEIEKKGKNSIDYATK